MHLNKCFAWCVSCASLPVFFYMVEQIRAKISDKQEAQKKNAKLKKRPAGVTSSDPGPKKRPAAAQQILKRPSSAMLADDDWQQFPGVPRKGKQVAPITVPGFGKIYSATKGGKWRCKKTGERVDKAFTWDSAPQASWGRLVEYVKSNTQ